MVYSFDAKVEGGQLVHADSLRPFEGQLVRITLETGLHRGAAQSTSAGDAGWPDDFAVEQDVYIPMPRRIELLKDAEIRELGPANSRI